MDRLNRDISRFATYILIYVASYVATAIVIRLLSKHFTIIEIAGLRSLGSIAIASTLLAWRGDGVFSALGSATTGDLLRSGVHLLGSLLLIWSVANLPLTFVAATEFTGPLFAAGALVLMTRRPPHPVALAGLGCIGLGAMLLLLSQGRSDGIEVVAPFAAVLALTVSNLLLATLARTRGVLSIILTMHALQLPVYAAVIAVTTPSWSGRTAAFGGHDLASWAQIGGAIVVLAVGGFATQAALAAASRHSTRLQLCAVDILRIPAVGVAAYLAFGEIVSPSTLLFSAVIVAGALVASWPDGSGRDEEGKAADAELRRGEAR